MGDGAGPGPGERAPIGLLGAGDEPRDTLRADCVDEDRFRPFYLSHFGRGPEVGVCGNGSNFDGVLPCQ
ncbi:MAG: hypothetical protein ABI488_18110 [Polyangiaceae bacterium]